MTVSVLSFFCPYLFQAIVCLREGLFLDWWNEKVMWFYPNSYTIDLFDWRVSLIPSLLSNLSCSLNLATSPWYWDSSCPRSWKSFFPGFISASKITEVWPSGETRMWESIPWTVYAHSLGRTISSLSFLATPSWRMDNVIFGCRWVMLHVLWFSKSLHSSSALISSIFYIIVINSFEELIILSLKSFSMYDLEVAVMPSWCCITESSSSALINAGLCI